MHLGQILLSCVSVLNNIPMDQMLNYVSGSTSAAMCFVFPFAFYYKVLTLDKQNDNRLRKAAFMLLIVIFGLFQVLTILSFIFPDFFAWLN